MNSFKEKLRNLVNDSLIQNQNINLEQNLNQSIINTQRKINKDNNFIYIERNIPKNNFNRNNYKNKQSVYSNIKDNINLINNNIISKNNNINNIYNNNIDFRNYTFSGNFKNFRPKNNNYNINKAYKNLYNKSCINLNNSTYNKNKAYLNYKNRNDYIFNNNKLNNLKNFNTYNDINTNKLIKKSNSFSSNNLRPKSEILKKIKSYQEDSNVKPNNLFNINNKNSNLYSFNLNENFSPNENIGFISKNGNRVSKSIKKKIKSLISESDKENISYKNISFKPNRILTSELLQFDNKYYNNKSTVLNLNNRKNKKELKLNYYNYYSNRFNNNNNYKKSSKFLSYYNLTLNNIKNIDSKDNYQKRFIVKEFKTKEF